jgi:hypothetical protein
MIQLTPANFCLPHFTLKKFPLRFNRADVKRLKSRKVSQFSNVISQHSMFFSYSFTAERRDRTYSRGKKIDFVQTIREIEELHPMTTT